MCLCLLGIGLSLRAQARADDFEEDFQAPGYTFQQATAREGILLRRFGAHAQREGAKLVVKKQGKILATFRDNVVAEALDDGKNEVLQVFYRLVDVDRKSRTLTITVSGWEAGSVVLINYDTGQQADIGVMPIWSPSRGRFAVAYCADSNDHSLEIWRVGQGTFIKEWSSNDCGFGARWDSDDHVTLAHTPWDPEWDAPAESAVKRDCRYRSKRALWICN